MTIQYPKNQANAKEKPLIVVTIILHQMPLGQSVHSLVLTLVTESDSH